ncbi:hypothetical protein D3875_02785 [Deinococcus cavernae]|uniref:Uncharacterized protein n=1 Tax=Deinococcus cavernae TaxID=2320857 RepID=A0A418VFS0_9DEIO|nr:hypothetical protein [Deinococcus cavernae]RJF74938.1 hypothetical protein D3875_02785 [Deinococcus cavernae]
MTHNIQEPAIGRIVHYVAYGTPGGEFKPAHRAAIVTEIHETSAGLVKLCILNPTGMFFSGWLPLDPSGEGSGTWHWPERA